MRNAKKMVWLFSACLAAAGCTRNASEGAISIKVLDFVDKQPERLLAEQAPKWAPAAATAPASRNANTTVCLVDSGTDAALLGKVGNADDCGKTDADMQANFTREEGAKHALVDLDGDGVTDSITFDVNPGDSSFAEVTSLNFRQDGGYILTKNDKVIYNIGDTITIRVIGFVPAPESIHIEIWNNWNGGFHYWSSATREVSGSFDYTIRMVIPSDWPKTNDSTGASYFSYPVSDKGVYNGDNFVLLDGRGGENEPGGRPPLNPSIVLEGGAVAVSSPSVTATLKAEDADFYRVSNDRLTLEAGAWLPLRNSAGTNIPWSLTNGADGSRVVFAQFASKFGVTSETVLDDVLLDTTPIVISNLSATPVLAKKGTVIAVAFDLSEEAAGGLTVRAGSRLVATACTNLHCVGTLTLLGSEIEGATPITVRAIDRVGWTSTASASVTVDFTPPDTSFVTPLPTGPVSSNAAALQLASTENGATFECKVDGGTFAACSADFVVNSLADGPHTVAARAIDAAGNIDATPAVYSWTVDTLPPETTLQSGPLGPVTASTASFTFTSPSPDAIGFECSLDGSGFAACASPAAYASLSNGSHSFSVRAVDAAGNVDPTAAYRSWSVDNEAPDTQIASAPPALTGSRNANVAFFSYSQDVAQYECSLDGAAFASCSSPNILTALADGPHSFAVRARDFAGNLDATPATTAWSVDATAPDTVINSSPAPVTSQSVAQLTFSSPASDVADYECSIDGAAYNSCVSPVGLSSMTVGTHSFAVRARDNAGNIDTSPAFVSWTIDSTPPNTSISSGPASLSAVTDASFVLVADEPATFECKLDGGLFASCVSPYLVWGLGDGPHTLEVRAKDYGGLVDATPAVYLWTVDLTPPESTITQAPAAFTTQTLARFAFQANEAATFQCELDGNAGIGFVNCTSPFTALGLDEGSHTFRVRAVDTVGNIEPEASELIWTIDRTPPAVNNLQALPYIAAAGGTFDITFDASEPLSSVSVTVGGRTALLIGQSGLNYSFIYTNDGSEGDGPATVWVSVTDLAGNQGSAQSSVYFDFQPPETFFLQTPPVFTNSLEAVVGFDSNEVATFECSINGSSFNLCASPFTETPLIEGTYTFEVRAIDWINKVDPSPAQTTWTVDYTPPAAPDPAKLAVTIVLPPGNDQLTCSAGAAEAGAVISVYADAALTLLVSQTIVLGDGSCSTFEIGNNRGDSLQQVYVTAVDAAGNESAATPIRNPTLPPRVTRALVHAKLDIDANGNGIGNPGDTVRVTWDNTADGDANTFITSASAALPGLGLGPVVMTDIGGGMMQADFVLAEGAFDSSFAGTVMVVGEGPLVTGPVASIDTATVDVELPAAPSPVSAATRGSRLSFYWTASYSSDVTSYVGLYGEDPTAVSTFAGRVTGGTFTMFTTVPACTDQYYAVVAVDDAGNASLRLVNGPESVSVSMPTVAAWGAVGGAMTKVFNAAGAEHVEIHFAMTTEAVGAPPWSSSYTQYLASPVTSTPGIKPLMPLKGGTEYSVATRSKKSTCYSDFTTTVTVKTLNYVEKQGGVAICPGCVGGTLPGRWYFGGLGFAVAGVGDAWGGDGKEDILTAVPGQTLAVLVSADPLEEQALYYEYYASQDVVGGGPNLASAGDVGGDGKEDFLIGSPLATTNGVTLRGMVRVIDSATGAERFRVLGTQGGQQLGYSVSSIGDLGNGDGGLSEIIAGGVGCTNFSCSDTNATAGVAHVISSSGAIIRSHWGTQVGNFFGVSVHGGVDINGDSVPDYVIGGPGHVGDDSPRGIAKVYSGASGSELFTLTGSFGERFGFSVRLADAGGEPIVIVGAPNRDPGLSGNVYIYNRFGEMTGILMGAIPEASENFGAAAVSGGDLDGDGVDEIIIGDPNIPLSAQFGTGRAFVYDSVSQQLLFEITGGDLDGALGYALDYLGDNNGDGIDDMVVGAPGAAIDGIYNAGRIYVLSIK